MGVIQNSLNQAMGSVAGAALGISHIKNQDLAAAEQASLKAPEAKEAIADTEAELGTAYLDHDNKLGELAGLTDSPIDRIKAAGLASEIEMSERAISVLEEKLTARQAMLTRIEKTMHRADKWGGIK